jgi:hypothetical protein
MVENGFDCVVDIVGFNGNTQIGQGVDIAPRFVEGGETLRVAGQRTHGCIHDAPLYAVGLLLLTSNNQPLSLRLLSG